MDRFLAELDDGRQYRKRGGLIGEVLDWLSHEGFHPTMQRLGVARQNAAMWESPRRFRERYMIAAIAAKVQ